jgi:uncharacterized Zn-binding protein involved in type VI secretion
MKHKGRGVIRTGDQTDHGGTVLAATSGTIVMGKPAALKGDLTICPTCKGTFPITPDGNGASHNGKPYAYQDDVTACGAKLISSVC